MRRDRSRTSSKNSAAGRNVTSKTAYFVCGSGVGAPFKTALKHSVPLLSADYFEDMARYSQRS